MPKTPFEDFTLISQYTRAQAIADGALVDVSDTAREAGLRYPVALTAATWAECVRVPDGVKGQDERGRLYADPTVTRSFAFSSEEGERAAVRIIWKVDDR